MLILIRLIWFYQGKGEYSMEYSRYSPAMADVQQQVVQKYRDSLEPANSDKKKKKNWII